MESNTQENKTLIDLQTIRSNVFSTHCGYCHSKRETFNGPEENLKNIYAVMLNSNKIRADDYENLTNKGFSRCGNSFYIKDAVNSCCECYQYKVDMPIFQLNKQQRSAIKRFHRYLETGKT